ncbi:hypothetical protein KUTeg_022448 [Tegillarca granosa]|uniref:RNase H type-1 domain-containing protein n=1 Tax=Tegillarca granosa TaxID=220873 RepID=A0ABQ9E936_TEGGR|nr:hypothetical protein KUTeg_022448 [Tegillarca granosa]
MCQVLVRLRYFINLQKSVFSPSRVIRFLGLLIDSCRLAFIIPEDKKDKFSVLEESLLLKESVDILSSKKFAGKCISFLLAVPAVKLYTKEVNKAISSATKGNGWIKVSRESRDEICYWRFLDQKQECFTWRKEKRLQISLASDASYLKWGAKVDLPECKLSFSDFWLADDVRPIHVKEAEALLNAFLSVSDIVKDQRVNAYVDNLACVHAWQDHSGKDVSLFAVIKKIWDFTLRFNVELILHYISSSENPADKPSRKLSAQD